MYSYKRKIWLIIKITFIAILLMLGIPAVMPVTPPYEHKKVTIEQVDKKKEESEAENEELP